MADDDKKVSGASTATSFADRGADGLGGGDNRPVPAGDAASDPGRDPLAYREKGDNGRRRAEHMERLLVDHFYGGSTRRFDEAAGLDFDAA